jgi:hypothetical protein
LLAQGSHELDFPGSALHFFRGANITWRQEVGNRSI